MLVLEAEAPYCNKDGAGHECSPELEPRKKPVTEDYVEKNGKAMQQLDVQLAPYAMKMWRTVGRQLSKSFRAQT